jgi:hypothetical protein
VSCQSASRLSPAVFGLAHGPHGFLRRAKTALGVDSLAGAVEIDLDVETVLAAAHAEIIRYRYGNFIDSGPEIEATQTADAGVAFTNGDFGFSIATTVETDAHFPLSYALAFDQRVRRHIEILNLQAVAAAASDAAANVRCQGCRHQVHEQ